MMQKKTSSLYHASDCIFAIVVDTCSSSPFQNDGLCVLNRLTGHLCTCLPGYSDPYCESKKYVIYSLYICP